jgi:hypothetical protein
MELHFLLRRHYSDTHMVFAGACGRADVRGCTAVASLEVAAQIAVMAALTESGLPPTAAWSASPVRGSYCRTPRRTSDAQRDLFDGRLT